MKLLRAGFKPLFDQNFYQTNWALTDHCNFHCSYCVNKHKRAGGLNLARETMLRTLDGLRQTDKDHFTFALEGGEVTLYKHLDTMLEYIARNFADKRYAVRLVSNGSASAERMRELLGKCGSGNGMFIITLHLEEVDVGKMIDKLLSFDRQAEHVLVKLLIAPGKLREGLEIVNTLQASGFSNFRVLHVLDFVTGMIDPGYTRDELEAIEALRNKCGKEEYFVFFNEYALPNGDTEVKTFTYTEGIKNGLLNYCGMLCAAGACSIKISPDGSFAKTEFCGDMPYSLNDKNPFADPTFTRPMRCVNPHCTCVAYTKLPKWREEIFAPCWLRPEGI